MAVRKIYYSPLSGGFMIASMLGFMISAVWIADINNTWGFSMAIIFVVMFLASVVSMTHAPAESLLQIDKKRLK